VGVGFVQMLSKEMIELGLRIAFTVIQQNGHEHLEIQFA
jgi:hypothetical protein